jgi:hypothetical protein
VGDSANSRGGTRAGRVRLPWKSRYRGKNRHGSELEAEVTSQLARLKIQVRLGLPTTHPESSHPLQRAVQAIITRTHGPHLWNEIRAVWRFNRCWVRAVWGEVYRARDTRRLDRIVAVKILPAHLSDNPETQAAL